MKKNLVVISTLSLALAGCGLTLNQKDAAARLASASTDLGNFSADELATLRENTIRLNIKDIALGGKAQLGDLDEAFDANDVASRIKAAEALSTYGRLLMALVNDTQEAELKSASNQFISSLKGISDKALSNSELDDIGKAVYGIGIMFVEHQKAVVLRKIVKKSKGDIDKLCDLLTKDFNRTMLNLAQGQDGTIKRLTADAAIALKTPTLSIADRAIASDAFKYARDQKERMAAVDKKAIEAITKLKAVNSELVDVLENDHLSLSSTQELGQTIKELAAFVKAFSGQ